MRIPRPLNGVKTHPLSDHARGVLRSLGLGPFPAQEINPGVVNRLLRESLAEVVYQESPYKNGDGKKINWLRITEAGRAAVAKAQPSGNGGQGE